MTNDHAELLTQLTSGISELASSMSWSRHLEYQSRFHHYSFGNVVLIAAQCPEATRVAGFRTWKRLERNVRKGEKAIWILAPMRGKKPDGEEPTKDKVVR
jgi:hypothetical protein